MDTDHLVFLEVDGDDPQWARTAAYSPAGNDIFVPIELCTDGPDLMRLIETRQAEPHEPWVRASVGGRPTLLMRARWLAEMFPDAANEMRELEEKIRALIVRVAN